MTVLAPVTRPDTVKLHLRVHDLSHPGSISFFSIGDNPHALIAACVAQIFQQLYGPGKRYAVPPVRSVTVYVESFDGIAFTTGSKLDPEMHKEVHLSTKYIASCPPDRLEHEIRGVLLHELVHALQWNGKGSCPGGLIEGIADYVRLKCQLDPPHWRRGGTSWDQGYETTAYFLEYASVSLKKPELVAKLNDSLSRNEWNDGKVLRDLLGGRTPEDVWKEYKKSLEPTATAAPALPTHTA